MAKILLINDGIQFMNPDGLRRKRASANVITVLGVVKTVYVDSQNAVDDSGAIVGKGDIGAQAERVVQNLQIALAEAGAQLEHVVKWNVYVVHGQPLQPALGAFRRLSGDRPTPPEMTLTFVAGLSHPDFLIEMDAVAVAPQ